MLEHAQTVLAAQLSLFFFKDWSLRQRLVHTVLELETHHPLMQPQAQGDIGAPRTNYALTF